MMSEPLLNRRLGYALGVINGNVGVGRFDLRPDDTVTVGREEYLVEELVVALLLRYDPRNQYVKQGADDA